MPANLIVELCIAASALCPSGPDAQHITPPDVPGYVFVLEDDLAESTWNRLRGLGYVGIAEDDAEALYVDERAVYAVASTQRDADFVATYLMYPGTECWIERSALNPPELLCDNDPTGSAS
jgi:hypothetical protein